jgi:23S rRNA (cytosine1962-C5)-methyltransferase
MPLPILTVLPGKEKPLLRHHPWIFSGAIKTEPKVAPGSLVEVRDTRGRFLATAYYNAHSKIRARALSFTEGEVVDDAFFARRIAAAVARRQPVLARGDTTATRLVMSEADQLPGLIVDQYGDYLVVQALTAGIDRHLGAVTAGLRAATRAKGIYERSDDAVRELEGLPSYVRLLDGEEPPAAGVEIRERGLVYSVDLVGGHKTGYYLDQRENHAAVREVAAGRDVLDCFCYTGGFSVSAAAGGAKSVLSIDASGPALGRVRTNLALNGFTGDAGSAGPALEQREGNAFELLRTLRDQGRTFDLVVLDPPKFAAHAGQIDKAARGYKDVNLLAFKMLRPGGLLATFSCSGHVSPDLFQKIVFGAAADAGVEAQIVRHLYQADDHPVLLSFPESLYLKGLLCRVL